MSDARVWVAGLLCASACTRTEEVLTRHQPLEPTTSAVTGADAGATSDHLTDSVSTVASPSTDNGVSSGTSSPTEEPGSSQPSPILTAPRLVVGTGFETTCLALNEEQVSVFGCFGALNLDPAVYSSERGRAAPRLVAFDGGEGHMCLLTNAGVIHCWGRNSSGQLGAGTQESRDDVVEVRLPEPATSLSSGGSHVCAITTSGQLYCWGENSEGQLGSSDPSTEEDDGGFSARGPRVVEGGPWQVVSAGFTHTCAIRSDGSLWCWGRNTQFQVSGNGQPQVRAPLRVTGDATWMGVTAGQSHTCALQTNGSLWCWGSDATADADYPLSADPDWQWQAPRPVTDNRWTALTTRVYHSCATSTDNDLWCWGRNEEGQLGMSHRENQPTPARVLQGVQQVSLGQFHTCVVLGDTDVRCTGSNEFGQLGPGGERGRDQFVSVIEQLQTLLLRLRP